MVIGILTDEKKIKIKNIFFLLLHGRALPPTPLIVKAIKKKTKKKIAASLRGKGFGRRMLELQFQYIKDQFPNANHTISAIPDIDLPDEAFNSGKFGERLKKACKLKINIDLHEYKFPGSTGSELTALSKEEFRQILKNGDVCRLTGVNMLDMNWVPILLDTEEDIEFAVRKDALAVVGKVGDSVSSLSILTWPIPAPVGLRGSLDIISGDTETCKSHVKTQLRNLFTMENRSRHAKRLIMELVFDPAMLESVKEVLAELHLLTFQFLLNKLERDRDHMYIYKQAL